MKVKQLIKELEKLENQDAYVYYYINKKMGYNDVQFISIDKDGNIVLFM